MTILIVDDNPGVRRLLRRALGRVATHFFECVDGTQAASMYAECLPDVVLMDIKMQYMDGLAATKAIRQSYPAARIIMLTDYDDDELRIAARTAGASEYVLKQDLTNLESIVNKCAIS